MPKLRLAALISGTGRTLLNFHKLIGTKQLSAQIIKVICNNTNSIGSKKAIDMRLPIQYVTLKQCNNSSIEQSSKIFAICKENNIDLICMAGWNNILTIPEEFYNKVMNIHPSLLPSFGGKGMFGINVHKAVLEKGCKISGCTVHFADNDYDSGPIIAQSAVEVYDTDTPEDLAARVFVAEKSLYPKVINAYAQGRISVNNRKVTIKNEFSI